jgi:hypothetical protein
MSDGIEKMAGANDAAQAAAAARLAGSPTPAPVITGTVSAANTGLPPNGNTTYVAPPQPSYNPSYNPNNQQGGLGNSDGVSVEMDPTVQLTQAEVKSQLNGKHLINAICVLIGCFGILGCFYSGFDMEKYIKFVNVYVEIVVPLMIVVGAGRAVKNFTAKRYGGGK